MGEPSALPAPLTGQKDHPAQLHGVVMRYFVDHAISSSLEASQTGHKSRRCTKRPDQLHNSVFNRYRVYRQCQEGLPRTVCATEVSSSCTFFLSWPGKIGLHWPALATRSLKKRVATPNMRFGAPSVKAALCLSLLAIVSLHGRC